MNTVPTDVKDPNTFRRLHIVNAIQAIEANIQMNDAPDYFQALVRSLATVLQMEYALVSEYLGETKWRVRTLGLWISDHFGKNTEYSLHDTPCAKVMKGVACYYPSSIQTLFPRDLGLQHMHAQSYLGVPAKNAYGEVIGHLVIIDTKVMQDKPFLLAILNYFALKVAEELERRDRA